MTAYSAEYLEGIKDGRAALKDAKAFGLDIAEEARRDLAFCDRVSHCYGSALADDYTRGLRDFWRQQLRTMGAANA